MTNVNLQYDKRYNPEEVNGKNNNVGETLINTDNVETGLLIGYNNRIIDNVNARDIAY